MVELNKTNLKVVADHLRIIPSEQFDMCGWIQENTECGTKACIGGHTVLLLGNRKDRAKYANISDYAAYLLGLTEEQEKLLFCGGWADSDNIEAADVLDELRTTGKINEEWADGCDKAV